MKKIGIVTFHRAHNYGAMLQVYALQEKIKNIEKDNNVEIIDYYNTYIYDTYKWFSISNNGVKDLIKSLLRSIRNFFTKKKRSDNFNKFLRKYLNVSKKMFSEKELKSNKLDYTCMITGSDQVWSKIIVNELSDIYTLNFGNQNINRISYAASLGNPNIKEIDFMEYKQKISKIDYISVREESARLSLNSFIDKDISVCLDPTLLLTQNEWIEKLKLDVNDKYKKYILAYCVEPDGEFIKIINFLTNKTGLKVIHFGYKDNGIEKVLERAYNCGPEDFLKLIRNAEYIVCTSFHATVFSIIFNKKFFVIPHKTTGARVIDLLKKLEITDRAVQTLQDFENKDYDSEIEYESVNYILDSERKNSINWLKNAINNRKDNNE